MTQTPVIMLSQNFHGPTHRIFKTKLDRFTNLTNNFQWVNGITYVNTDEHNIDANHNQKEKLQAVAAWEY